jgi:hypothetical protein
MPSNFIRRIVRVVGSALVQRNVYVNLAGRVKETLLLELLVVIVTLLRLKDCGLW